MLIYSKSGIFDCSRPVSLLLPYLKTEMKDSMSTTQYNSIGHRIQEIHRIDGYGCKKETYMYISIYPYIPTRGIQYPVT